MMKYIDYLQTPCGWLEIQNDGQFLLAVHFVNNPVWSVVHPNPLGEQAKSQLIAYFNGQRVVFNLPLAPFLGTPFQQAVWGRLRTIAYGQTRTYGQLAAEIQKPAAARAVGQACHLNPWGIVVPCHRVVGAGGRLTGYAGGLDKKSWLLEWERRH